MTMIPTSSTTAANFLFPLGLLIYYAVNIYIILVVIRVLLSWVSPNPYTPVMRFLIKITDPLLVRARQIMPLTLGGLDFSPILAIIVLQLGGVALGKWLMAVGQGAPLAILLPILAFALIGLLSSIAWLLIIIMALRLIMSLVHPSPYNILVQIIYGLSEPLLAPLRRFFPPGPGGFDTRALVFLLIVVLVNWVLVDSLAGVIGTWTGGLISGVF